jgi:enoyl-CoA hydratase
MGGAPQCADFYEGVRAALIDKDRQPQWSPATVEEVRAASVQQCFEPLVAHLAALYCPPPAR